LDLSIVIVNWNTRDLLSDCLSSVLAGLVGLEAEVFVVDNASIDGSQEMVIRDFPEVQLIRNAQNMGFAAANNIALRIARGRHVLLLNSDTVVHGHVLSAAVAWMDTRPSVGLMGPRILNADGSPQVSATAFPSLGMLALQTLGVTRIPQFDSYRLTAWDRRETRPVDVISGCAMLVRRTAMIDVGLLDESFFFFGEETDWCRRFSMAGWAVVFAPVGEITHFGGGSVRRLNHKRDVMLTEGTVRLHRKHGGLAGAIASYAILAVFNASRAAFWTLAAAAHRPGAAERARHFGAVLGDFGKAWPRQNKALPSC
jgi:GT2 family glycosyltransferase